MPQHADPLISFLDVEIAQILKTENGVGDAGVSQVGSAQVNPLGGKLRLEIQQRAEGCGKGRNPTGGFHAHNSLRRDFHQANIRHHIPGIFRQEVIQHSRMGVFSGHQQFPVFLLPQTQRLGIFIHSCLYAHKKPPERRCFTHIS